MSFTEIAIDVAEGVATITLDRPDRLNAFTPTMTRELIAAFDRTDEDDSVRAVVVTGRGRAFCAGADLGGGGETFAALDDPGAERASTGGRPVPPRDEGGLVTLRLFRSAKPVIAAINGPAVGVGISMTLAMDVRVLSDDAKVGFVFGARGIAPDAAASWFLPRIVGIDQALEWCLTGRVFRADEALAGGLVRSVHPKDEVLAVATALAREMAVNVAPVSATVTRNLLWRMLGAAHPMEAHRLDSDAIAQLGRSADAREGITAFLQKRPAAWTGSVPADLPVGYPWWDDPAYDG